MSLEDVLSRGKHRIPSKYQLDPEAIAKYKEEKLREKVQQAYEEYLRILKREEFRKVFVPKYQIRLEGEKTEEQLKKEHLLTLEKNILTLRRRMIDRKISTLLGDDPTTRIETMSVDELNTLLDLFTLRKSLTTFPTRYRVRVSLFSTLA